jgi:hypothetical protein
MARPKGFEPLTPRFVVWCSIQLSYGRPYVVVPSLMNGSRVAWSEWQDLNLRPARPERGRVPTAVSLRRTVRQRKGFLSSSLITSFRLSLRAHVGSMFGRFDLCPTAPVARSRPRLGRVQPAASSRIRSRRMRASAIAIGVGGSPAKPRYSQMTPTRRRSGRGCARSTHPCPGGISARRQPSPSARGTCRS